jgi:hypothetical protein
VTAIAPAYTGKTGLVVGPSGDTTGAADHASLQAALTAAGPTGGVVQLQPGDYVLNAPLVWDQRSAVADVHAPSIIGAGSGGDPTTAATGEGGVTRLIASTSFPSGEFMIDYLGPTAVNVSMAGFTVANLLIQGCDSGGTPRAAGIRGFNQWQARWQNIAIIKPQVPSPAVKPGGISPAGAVSMYASPTSNALMNQLDQIWVMRAQFDGFYLQEGPGSFLVATGCSDFNSSAHGFHIGPFTTLTGCNASREGFAQFYIHDDLGAGGANVQMIGCQSLGTFTSDVQALLMTGDQFLTLQATACSFGWCANANGGGDLNSVMSFSGYCVATFTGCLLASTNANINKYVSLAASMTAGSMIQLDGCQLTGGPWGHTPAAVYNLNSNPASMLRIDGCQGVSPFGTQTVAVPATTVATAGLPFDSTFYVTGAAGGSCTIAVSGGPTVTVPASTLIPVYVPAGSTVTPTYGAGNAPTWAVEGH